MHCGSQHATSISIWPGSLLTLLDRGLLIAKDCMQLMLDLHTAKSCPAALTEPQRERKCGGLILARKASLSNCFASPLPDVSGLSMSVSFCDIWQKATSPWPSLLSYVDCSALGGFQLQLLLTYFLALSRVSLT